MRIDTAFGRAYVATLVPIALVVLGITAAVVAYPAIRITLLLTMLQA